MQAVMMSARMDDPFAEYKIFDMKNMVEYSSWLLRASARGYEIYREEPDHLVIYLSSKTHPNVKFQVAFREGTCLADYTKGLELGLTLDDVLTKGENKNE